MKCRSRMSWSKAAVAALPSGVCKPSLRGFSLIHLVLDAPLCFGTCPLLSRLIEASYLYHSCRKVPEKHMAGSMCNRLPIRSKALGHSWGPCEAYTTLCSSIHLPVPVSPHHHHTRPVHRVTNGSLPLLLPRLSVSSSSWCALWLSP